MEETASSSSSSSDQKYLKYNPYLDLHNVPAHRLYHVPTGPEYLFHEESLNQRRSWGESLQYHTGGGYFSGAILGGIKGAIEGLHAAEASDTLKLRLNRVLNSGGHAGGKLGCKLGVIGLMYAGFESALFSYRGTDDTLNSVLAGFATGALYRSARGPKSAVIGGAIGGIVAGAAAVGKKAARRYLPILGQRDNNRNKFD